MTDDRASKKTRGEALVAAEHDRVAASADAQMEYSETVHKARDHFEAELADASEHLIERVTPAYRAYNAAVVGIEARPQRDEG